MSLYTTIIVWEDDGRDYLITPSGVLRIPEHIASAERSEGEQSLATEAWWPAATEDYVETELDPWRVLKKLGVVGIGTKPDRQRWTPEIAVQVTALILAGR